MSTQLTSNPRTSPRGVGANGVTRQRRKFKRHGEGATPVAVIVSILVLLFTLGPVLYAVLGGFRTNAQLASAPAGMPDPWEFGNYAYVLKSASFWRYTGNSVFVGVITTLIVVVFGMMAAYPLARYRFKGREVLYTIFVAGLLFPMTVAVIPLFIIITQDLNLGNNHWGIILPQAAFALPMTVIILRPFLQGLPKELEEAALLDGASRVGFFWRILTPLSSPAMVTVGVLAFVASWNAYLLPMLLLKGDLKTLPLGVADFSTQYSSDTAGVFAFTSLSMIPALIFFLAMQNRIVNGLQGAVKG